MIKEHPFVPLRFFYCAFIFKVAAPSHRTIHSWKHSSALCFLSHNWEACTPPKVRTRAHTYQTKQHSTGTYWQRWDISWGRRPRSNCIISLFELWVSWSTRTRRSEPGSWGEGGWFRIAVRVVLGEYDTGVVFSDCKQCCGCTLGSGFVRLCYRLVVWRFPFWDKVRVRGFECTRKCRGVCMFCQSRIGSILPLLNGEKHYSEVGYPFFYKWTAVIKWIIFLVRLKRYFLFSKN